MPRPNTSETVKKQIRFLLERLLTHVNNESSEQDYDYWEKKLSVRWSKDPKKSTNLIVQTELKVLVNFCNEIAHQRSGVRLTVDHMRNCLKILKEWEILADNRAKTQGSLQWHFTLNLWHSSTEENLKKFEEEWDKRKYNNLQN